VRTLAEVSVLRATASAVSVSAESAWRRTTGPGPAAPALAQLLTIRGAEAISVL